MKKLTLFLSAMLLACATNLWADVATLTFSAACEGSGTDDKKNTWTVTSDAEESTYDGTKGIHYGTSKKAVSYLTLTNSTITGTITKIVVNASGASSTSAKLDVTVGDVAFGSQQTLTGTATDYTFEGSATGEIEVKLSQTSATKALYVKSIAVTYSTVAATVATPVFTAPEGVVREDGTFGAAFDLTISCKTMGASVYYTLDGTDPKESATKVLLGADSKVSIPAATTRVRAIATNGTDYSEEKDVTYTFDPSNVATLTFNAACKGSGTDDKKNTWTVTSDAAESNFDNSKGIHYGTSSKAVSYLTLTNSTITGTITKIVVNASGASSTSAKLDVTVGDVAFGSQQTLTGTATDYTFEGSATGEIEVKLSQTSATKALYVKSIAVTYSTDAATVATPVLTAEDGKVAGGEFVEAFELTMTCATAEATILYTLDESDPKTNGTIYTDAITISETTTVRAIAKSGEEWSREATETYTKLVALTTMDEIFATATEAGKNNTVTKYVTFNDWIVTGVKGSNAYLTDGTKGLIIYTSSHGFKAGDMLSGTVSCDITLFNGNAEIMGLTTSTTGLTVTQGGTAPVQTPAIKDLSAINTGSIISLSNLTCNGTVLADAEGNKITPYDTFITLPTMTNGKKYNVKGVYIDFRGTKEIAPLAESDIQEVTTPTAIDNATVETPAVKTIENGQLVIIRDGVKYNAMGVRLQ